MGADRKPAQNVFGADDGECEALERAIDGGDDHQSARLHERRAAPGEEIQVGDVLHHFRGDHHVEGGIGLRQRLHGRRAVIDRKAIFLGVELGGLDILLRRINAGDFAAEARERLRYDSAAAADVKKRQFLQAIAQAQKAGDVSGGVSAKAGRGFHQSSASAAKRATSPSSTVVRRPAGLFTMRVFLAPVGVAGHSRRLYLYAPSRGRGFPPAFARDTRATWPGSS